MLYAIALYKVSTCTQATTLTIRYPLYCLVDIFPLSRHWLTVFHLTLECRHNLSPTTNFFSSFQACTSCNNYTLLSKLTSKCWCSPQRCTPACVRYWHIGMCVWKEHFKVLENALVRMITCHVHMLRKEHVCQASYKKHHALAKVLEYFCQSVMHLW